MISDPDEGILEGPVLLEEQQKLEVKERSILILVSRKAEKPSKKTGKRKRDR